MTRLFGLCDRSHSPDCSHLSEGCSPAMMASDDGAIAMDNKRIVSSARRLAFRSSVSRDAFEMVMLVSKLIVYISLQDY